MSVSAEPRLAFVTHGPWLVTVRLDTKLIGRIERPYAAAGESFWRWVPNERSPITSALEFLDLGNIKQHIRDLAADLEA